MHINKRISDLSFAAKMVVPKVVSRSKLKTEFAMIQEVYKKEVTQFILYVAHISFPATLKLLLYNCLIGDTFVIVI